MYMYKKLMSLINNICMLFLRHHVIIRQRANSLRIIISDVFPVCDPTVYLLEL